MFFLIYVVAGLSLCLCCSSKKIRDFIQICGYEAIYWVLGGAATVEDFIYSRKNKLKDLPKKSNEVAVVTGGTRGIGYEVVKKLLECDMYVIIGCRKVQAGEDAVQSIRAQGVTLGRTKVFSLDTSSMASVKSFALDVLNNTTKIHLLINNAGIMFVPFTITEDGFESHLSVNYLGHFLLTHLLLPTMKETGSKSPNHTRIVNTTSCAHIPGSIKFDDINYLKSLYIPSQAYAQSKLAQLMFSKALERKVRSEGARVSSFSVHPGVVNTELFDGTLLKRIAPWFPKLFFKTPEQGAVSILHAAISQSLEGQGGAYISNCRQTWSSPTANNVEKQEKLMDLTLTLLKL